MKIAVIPDIHGHLTQLRALLKAIGPCGAGRSIVQLGDFIDRGPDSRGCVELLKALQAKSPDRFVVLKGNHEAMLTSSDRDASALALWMGNGGIATLRSYGPDFGALCRARGPHKAWMEDLPLSWELHGVLFCHAGLSRSNVKKMDPESLLWTRPPLTRGPFRAVVCGHSPTTSGRVEHRNGVFRCDLGLGHRQPGQLEYLEIDLGPLALSWKVIPISSPPSVISG